MKKGKPTRSPIIDWRAKLEKTDLNEKTWKLQAVVIEASGSNEEKLYLKKFETFSTEGKRFLVRNICETETMFMVNQLGLEKKIKHEYSELFEISQSYLQNKDSIPSDLLALIIKFQIMKMKEDYLFITRQKFAVEEGFRRDSFTMLDREEFRGYKETVTESTATTVSPKSKGGKEELAVPEPLHNKKFNTRLRERGEEWRDHTFVDDFPTNGPNLYITVTGFLDPLLPVAMLKTGIPVVAIVQIHIAVSKSNLPQSLMRIGKRSLSQSEYEIERHKKFWKTLHSLRIKDETCNVLKNTAFIVFEPPYWADDILTGDPEKIYDEISYLMYDVQDLGRQHLHFLDNMDIIHIPEVDIDERYINAFIPHICNLPLEKVTIYSVLDGIVQVACLEQLNATTVLVDSQSARNPAKKSKLHLNRRVSKFHDMETRGMKLVSELFNNLCQIDADKKSYRVTYSDESGNNKSSKVVKSRDYLRYSTFYLCNKNVDNNSERDVEVNFHSNKPLEGADLRLSQTGISAADVFNNPFISHYLIDELEFCEDIISRKEWRHHIPTAVCLQDFFDYVLNEHYDWIANEEILYDQAREKCRDSLCSTLVEDKPKISCIDEVDDAVAHDLLMDGSLKHAKILELQEESQKTDAETDVSARTARKKGRPSSASSFKSFKSYDTSRKNAVPKVRHINSFSAEDLLQKPFLGYDFSDRRVELFGKDAAFLSRDSTKISSKYTLLIPQNVEYVALNIVPGDGNNEIWIHRCLNDIITPEILKKSESFRINTKDQVMINIKKETVPVSIEEPLHFDEASKVDPTLMSQADKAPQIEMKYYYGLTITWPNGLLIESVYETGSTNLSHIKQYRLSPIAYLNEDCRCITPKGEILIFKSSGEVVVLAPDGTMIVIDKYQMKYKVPDFEPEVPEKKKAEKARGKKKEEPEVIEEKPPELELIIDSFEITEPNGVRQRWEEERVSQLDKLFVRTAIEYCTGELSFRRIDGNYILLNKDGLYMVTFPDNTRIITSYEIEEKEVYPNDELDCFEAADNSDNISRSKMSAAESASSILEKVEAKNEESRTDGYISIHLIYTIEHKDFAAITIHTGLKEIKISSPNGTTVTVDQCNNYRFKLDEKGQTTGHFDGENLHINYKTCNECKCMDVSECDLSTTCDIKFENTEEIGTYSDSSDDLPKPWVILKQSSGQNVVVDCEGNINIQESVTKSLVNEEINIEDQSRVKDDSKSEDF